MSWKPFSKKRNIHRSTYPRKCMVKKSWTNNPTRFSSFEKFIFTIFVYFNLQSLDVTASHLWEQRRLNLFPWLTKWNCLKMIRIGYNSVIFRRKHIIAYIAEKLKKWRFLWSHGQLWFPFKKTYVCVICQKWQALEENGGHSLIKDVIIYNFYLKTFCLK